MQIVKIMALGGLNENGKNLYTIDIDGKLLIFDCGMKYAPDKMYGVDYIIPDFSYLVSRKNDIVGLFITHPHSENMGALFDLVELIPNIDVYASNFTSLIIELQSKEYGIEIKNLNKISAHKKIDFKEFSVFPFSATHSSPETLGFAVNTNNGAYIYMADYVIDSTRDAKYDMDLGRLAYIGKQGVVCLMCESVFAEKKGHTSPNHKLESFFKSVIDKYDGRIIFSLLSLHIYTIQEIFNVVKNTKRKVVIMGKELQLIVNLCIKHKYLDLDPSVIGNLTDLKNEDTIILISNDRENPYANINRIIANRDKFISFKKTDTVVFAEPSYDAYEKTLIKIMNELAIQSVNIETVPKDKSVRHHASSEDIMMLIKLFSPKYYMPIKGEYRYQVENANLAYKVGIDKNNIILKQNGDIVEFNNGVLKESYDHIFVDDILIDGKSSDDIGELVLKDREMLSINGLILISSTLNKKDKSILIEPQVITRGFIVEKDNQEIIDNIREISLNVIKDNIHNSKYADYVKIRNEMREKLGEYIYSQTKSKPVILTVIQEV